MANITTLQPIRYTQDISRDSAHGLITCGEGNYLDLSQADRVTAINIQTVPAELPASVKCAFAFNTGSGWFKLDSNGGAQTLDTQELTDDSVIEEGNSIAELAALTDITAFRNTQLRYAIALETTDPENIKPRVKFDIECVTLTQQLTQTVMSPEYEYADSIVITGVTADSSTASGGSLTIQGRYIDSNDTENSGQYSEWTGINNLTGVITNKLQFRAITTASEIGVSQSILNSLKVSYNEGGIIASSGGVSEIITVIQDWRVDLRHCRVVVRHSPLDQSYIKCYVTFRNKSARIKGELLGTGTGQRQTFILANTNGIRLESVRVYINGTALTGGYDVNCHTGRIIITADEGANITCDYEYGWESETWTELEKDYTESFDGYDQSVYRVTMPENISGDVKSIAGIKLALHTVRGTAEDEVIGTGQGILATYRLSEPVRNGVITIKAGGAELSANNYMLESDPRYVRVNGGIDAELTASYEWESESPVVYEVNGVFSK